jgi:transposase-like protein
LRQAASGTPISEITRKMGVITVTFYRWKKLCANRGIAEIRRLKLTRPHRLCQCQSSSFSLQALAS